MKLKQKYQKDTDGKYRVINGHQPDGPDINVKDLKPPPTESVPIKKTWTKKSPAKKKTPIKEEVISSPVTHPEEPRKLDAKKPSLPNAKCPRITISSYDDKGRLAIITYVCDPESLSIAKQEYVNYTSSGKRKVNLDIAIEAKIVEIE